MIPATPQTVSDIDRLFTGWNRDDAPGVAVGIVRDGSPIYTRCFGLANVEHTVPITDSTVFEIGSITKQFTAFAILLLERDGKLDLDDDIRDHLPELPKYDPPIRIRHCLYHTHGLSDWIWAMELAGPVTDYVPMKRAKRAILSFQPTSFPTGQAHSYCNTGYVLLAWIVARVAGKALPEFLRERVFDPLGMPHAGFRSDTNAIVPNLAQGYQQNESDRLYRISGASDVHGDGGMLASIDDMIRWLGNFTTQMVGGQEVLERFFAPGRLDNGQVLRYGAAWMLQRYRGFQSMHHGGLWDGFQSHVLWLPEARIGVAVLGNVRPYRPWVLATSAVDVLLKKDGKHPPVRAAPRKSVRKTTKSENVSGRYFTHTGLPVRVYRHGEQLYLDIWLWGRPFDEVSPDMFREAHSGDTVTFHRSDNGTVTHFTMETDDGACVDMHSPIIRAVKYDFTTVERRGLARFAGRYVNNAIESAYTVVIEGDGLTARHLRCHDWYLRPIRSNATCSFESDFAQEHNWPGIVTFEQDTNGDVTGFRVRSACADMFFRKQSPWTSPAF